VTWASWRQVSEHRTPAGDWCRWSEVTVRDDAAVTGCLDGCPGARVELVEREVPWQDSRFVGEGDAEAVA